MEKTAPTVEHASKITDHINLLQHTQNNNTLFNYYGSSTTVTPETSAALLPVETDLATAAAAMAAYQMQFFTHPQVSSPGVTDLGEYDDQQVTCSGYVKRSNSR